MSTRLTASRQATAGSSWSLGGGQLDSTSSGERQPLGVCRGGGEQGLRADALVLAIDVDAVYSDWGTPDARAVSEATPEWLRERSFASGSMRPKVEAGCRFEEATSGCSVIRQVDELAGLIDGKAGTVVAAEQARTGRETARTWWTPEKDHPLCPVAVVPPRVGRHAADPLGLTTAAVQ